MVRRKSTKTTTSQLPLCQMIIEAISTLKEISGSTQTAIADFIQDNNYDKAPPPPNFRKLVSVELKKLVESEKLSKNRNSYQLPSEDVAVSHKKLPKERKKISSRSKRLSQVKTPDGLKLKKQKVVVVEQEEEEVETAEVVGDGNKKKVGQQKVKRLSEVKTPEMLKKKMKKKPNK